MSTKTTFVIREDCTEALWADSSKPLFDAIKGEREVQRASHIDPVHMPAWYTWLNPLRWRANLQLYRFIRTNGRNNFGIFWKGPVRDWGITLTDNHGIPFTTKQAAIEFEVKMLQKGYFSLK